MTGRWSGRDDSGRYSRRSPGSSGAEVSGKTRFPDEITGTTIKEVKNVAKQGWTAQLKDSAEIAKQTGKTFELWVRKSTVLSGPLQAAEKAGQVFIKYLKGL